MLAFGGAGFKSTSPRVVLGDNGFAKIRSLHVASLRMFDVPATLVLIVESCTGDSFIELLDPAAD